MAILMDRAPQAVRLIAWALPRLLKALPKLVIAWSIATGYAGAAWRWLVSVPWPF